MPAWVSNFDGFPILMRAGFFMTIIVVAALAASFFPANAQGIYQTPAAFLATIFSGDVPVPERLTVTMDMRHGIETILRHSYAARDIRYWRRGERTAWVLEEIGKFRPITVGIVVSGGAIESVRVLIYRESHGWEVRHEFFVDQFKGLELDGENRLSHAVDGISGATLSVNALRNLARLALLFDGVVQGG